MFQREPVPWRQRSSGTEAIQPSLDTAVTVPMEGLDPAVVGEPLHEARHGTRIGVHQNYVCFRPGQLVDGQIAGPDEAAILRAAMNGNPGTAGVFVKQGADGGIRRGVVNQDQAMCGVEFGKRGFDRLLRKLRRIVNWNYDVDIRARVRLRSRERE